MLDPETRNQLVAALISTIIGVLTWIGFALRKPRPQQVALPPPQSMGTDVALEIIKLREERRKEWEEGITEELKKIRTDFEQVCLSIKTSNDGAYKAMGERLDSLQNTFRNIERKVDLMEALDKRRRN